MNPTGTSARSDRFVRDDLDPGRPEPGDDPTADAPEAWTRSARWHEYTSAANPIASGHTSRIPVERFPASLWRDAPTGIVPLDLSGSLRIDRGPATSPALLASFVRIRAGESVETAPVATSELSYVITGRGTATVDGEPIAWGKGDVLTLPAGCRTTWTADEAGDAALYHVTDEPLLRHLGVAPTERRFEPTLYPRATSMAELERIALDPNATNRNRISVLLNNVDEDQTLTVTHVLWAMLGLLPAGEVQAPHRHQSVALDLILDCEPGCYTLLSARVDGDGRMQRPVRVDWEPGGAFVTPPGMWHAHHNESGTPAHLLPIQDAGLQTYLRSLDIRFAKNPR